KVHTRGPRARPQLRPRFLNRGSRPRIKTQFVREPGNFGQLVEGTAVARPASDAQLHRGELFPRNDLKNSPDRPDLEVGIDVQAKVDRESDHLTGGKSGGEVGPVGLAAGDFG